MIGPSNSILALAVFAIPDVSAILVLNTVIKMQKNKFCLNFYTAGRNTKITTTGYIELSLPSWNTSTGMNHMLMNPLTKVKTLKLRFKVNTDIPKGTKDYIICAIPSGYEPKYYVENVSVTMMGVPYLLHVPQGGKSLYFSYNQSVILHDDEFFITLTFV